MRWYRIIAGEVHRNALFEIIRELKIQYMYLDGDRYFVKITPHVLLYLQIRFSTGVTFTSIVDEHVQLAVETTYKSRYNN